jgi:hypothetical protein
MAETSAETCLNNGFLHRIPVKPKLMRRKVLICLFTLCLSIQSQTLFAWVYPEHRQIALLAIQKLSPQFRATLDKIWADARTGYANRLTATVIDTAQGRKPQQLDWASWTAIAGDHSCSPENMLYNVLQTDWIMKVADIAAKLKIDIDKAKNNSQHVNAIRNSDIALQRFDPDYATRAGANNVHFLLSRATIATKVEEYIAKCFTPGAPLNALGAYGWFHTSAMIKAQRYAAGGGTPEERSALILSALADEAFGLHFLEDVFAAGHVAGTWGSASVRKGTHDYYNEKGLELNSWKGDHMIQTGDAYMRAQDANYAANTIQLSLEQLLSVVAGNMTIKTAPDDPALKSNTTDSFNVCTNIMMRQRFFDTALLEGILVTTPVPGLAIGKGELPRFRSELGMFLGVTPAISLFSQSGGFGVNQKAVGGIAGLEVNASFGFGLDGVLNNAGDGLVFAQVGWRVDGASTNHFTNTDPNFPANTLTAAIPGRQALNLRLRMPFWLIPGDLLIAGPILLLVSPKTLSQMAVRAGNGGLIPWQAGIATPLGRFQFVLGREVGVSFYSVGRTQDVFLHQNAANKAVAVAMNSTSFEFPVLEYRALRRSFSQTQSSALMLQAFGGFDLPAKSKATVLAPAGEPLPEFKTVWRAGIRMIFDFRKYFD